MTRFRQGASVPGMHGLLRRAVQRMLPLLLLGSSGALAAAPEGFDACLAGLKARALAEGVSASTADAVLDRISWQERVIELDRRQPEFTRTFADYYGTRVSDTRVSRGRELLRSQRDLLARIQAESGVPPHYLVAFWGLETNFGSYLGKMPIPDSLATLACDTRRSTFFSGELMAALRIIDAGDVDAEAMQGSWAGAMGHVQFMPSVYLRHAVDGDGDGRRDLFGSIPDALTSAGRFLQGLGWEPGLRWGREVRLPDGFDYALAGRDQRRPLSAWRALGVRDTSDVLLPDLDLDAAILVPAGHQGPAFVVYRNFDVIMGWNRSEFYALAVGRLADRIAGAGRLMQEPPDDELRLARNDVLALQAALNEAGFDSGEPDGILGPATRKALARFEQSKGLIPDGHPDGGVLEALQVRPQAAASATSS
jgi:membrane-bound lytic murein transglycosylase B